MSTLYKIMRKANYGAIVAILLPVASIIGRCSDENLLSARLRPIGGMVGVVNHI